jgi:hypothetical protein
LLKYCFDIKWKCSTFVQRWLNHFFGGLFKQVTTISLFGERPFEHEFFVRIAESFSSSEKLCLVEEKHKWTTIYISSSYLVCSPWSSWRLHWTIFTWYTIVFIKWCPAFCQPILQEMQHGLMAPMWTSHIIKLLNES